MAPPLRLLVRGAGATPCRAPTVVRAGPRHWGTTAPAGRGCPAAAGGGRAASMLLALAAAGSSLAAPPRGAGRRPRGRRAGHMVACGAAGEAVARSGILRSWWPLPLRGRGAGTATMEQPEDGSGASPEEELRLLRQTGPTRVAMLGTRECPYQHQQEIELLSEARVCRGDHIFTSGSCGTNSSVIRGALRARRPNLLTVILPQSFEKQDEDSQKLLRSCAQAGVKVQPMPENDRLLLAEAAQLCNTKVLNRVEKLVAFASHESSVYLSLIEEAKQNGIVATAFFLD